MRKLEELLEDYRSGLLSPEEERFVEEQLTEKPELLEEAQAIAFVWEAVKQQVKQDEKEKLKAQLLKDTELREVYEGERMKAVLEKKRADQRKRTRLWGQLAAASVALFVLFYFGRSYFQENKATDREELVQNILDGSEDSKYFQEIWSTEVRDLRGFDSTKINSLDDTLKGFFSKGDYAAYLNTYKRTQEDSLSTAFQTTLDSLQAAIAYYKTEDYQMAKKQIDLIKGVKENKLKDVYLWNKGLIYLKAGAIEEGIQQLCTLIEDYDYQSDKAQELLSVYDQTCL